MKNSSKSIVIHQPTNKKYLVEKTVIEMKDQNDNQTEGSIKEEPFIIDEHQDNQSQKHKTIYCSDGCVELDENGNPIEEKKREKRSVVKHRNWNVLDSIDSPILNSTVNLGSSAGRKTLNAIDYIGSMFASFLGITDSKYETEITQAKFENKEKKRRDNVIADAESGWK